MLVRPPKTAEVATPPSNPVAPAWAIADDPNKVGPAPNKPPPLLAGWNVKPDCGGVATAAVPKALPLLLDANVGPKIAVLVPNDDEFSSLEAPNSDFPLEVFVCCTDSALDLLLGRALCWGVSSAPNELAAFAKELELSDFSVPVRCKRRFNISLPSAAILKLWTVLIASEDT